MRAGQAPPGNGAAWNCCGVTAGFFLTASLLFLGVCFVLGRGEGRGCSEFCSVRSPPPSWGDRGPRWGWGETFGVVERPLHPSSSRGCSGTFALGGQRSLGAAGQPWAQFGVLVLHPHFRAVPRALLQGQASPRPWIFPSLAAARIPGRSWMGPCRIPLLSPGIRWGARLGLGPGPSWVGALSTNTHGKAGLA